VPEHRTFHAPSCAMPQAFAQSLRIGVPPWAYPRHPCPEAARIRFTTFRRRDELRPRTTMQMVFASSARRRWRVSRRSERGRSFVAPGPRRVALPRFASAICCQAPARSACDAVVQTREAPSVWSRGAGSGCSRTIGKVAVRAAAVPDAAAQDTLAHDLIRGRLTRGGTRAACDCHREDQRCQRAKRMALSNHLATTLATPFATVA
jgi:hypothetical protein